MYINIRGSVCGSYPQPSVICMFWLCVLDTACIHVHVVNCVCVSIGSGFSTLTLSFSFSRPSSQSAGYKNGEMKMEARGLTSSDQADTEA